MKMHALFLMLLFSSAINAQNSCRIWNEYVNSRKTNSQSKLLDFSFAGYHHSEIGVPNVKFKTFNVCDYGAIPNDELSDREAVIKAIKAAEENGSGIIYFPKGRYMLHNDEEPSVAITVGGSNIVFRGDGSGENGSEIFMKCSNPAVDPQKKWTSPPLFLFKSDKKSNKYSTVKSNSPKGSFSVTVSDASSWKAGDWVCLELKDNSPEVIAKELAPYSVEPKWTDLIKNGVQVKDYHQIVSVKGGKVTFKEPIMREVVAKEKWTLREFIPLKEVGVENLAFVGNWKEKFIHHKNWEHDGGWKMLQYNHVVNSWVRNCRFTDVSVAAAICSSANVSVFNCVVTGNRGHNSIDSNASSRVFLGKIDDQPSQWHSVGVAAEAIGTVLWRIKTRDNSCFESHASQPRATLIDACEGGFMRGRCGGAVQNNPNHLRDLVIWNYNELDEAKQNFDFWAKDTQFFRLMPPIIVGFHGAKTTFLSSQVEYEESNGKAVNPESLFEAQLKLRLGKLPKWLVELKKLN